MRKYIIYCLMVVLLIGLVPIGSSAAEDDGIYEVIIYPNGKGIQTLSGGESLVLGDVEVSYEVDRENNEIDIYFEEPIFVSDVISEGSTIHKTIKVNDFDEIEVNEELKTDGFMFASVNKLKMKYEDINSVEYIKIQSGNELDFSGGLLDGKYFRLIKSDYVGFNEKILTDENLSNVQLYKGTKLLLEYVFDECKDIGMLKHLIHIYNKEDKVVLRLYDEFDNLLMTYEINRSNYVYRSVNLDVNGVKKIQLSGYSPDGYLYLYEIDFYEKVFLEEVKNLDYIIEGNDITFIWENPGFEDFAGVNIYRNDVLIEENYMENNYIDEGLQPGTYEYKITTTDIFGNESKGITISAEIEKPPEEVKNLNYTVEDNSKIILTWKNPDNENFEGVNIYRDGKLIATTTEESFTESLSPGIYEYRITTIEAGKESPGVTIDVSVEFVSPPTVVKNIRIFNRTSTGGTVTWDLNPAYENIEKYIVYVNGEKHGEIEAPPYPLEGLEEGKTYTISVQAVNSYGISEPPSTVTFTPTELSEIGNSIKVGDIFSYVSMLFKNMWPLLALVLAIILSPKIYHLIKSNVT